MWGKKKEKEEEEKNKFPYEEELNNQLIKKFQNWRELKFGYEVHLFV